jgi:ABC-2 type transport system permease protein
MTPATVIARRELSSYFYSPLAYVAMVLFLLASAFLFYNDFQPGQVAGMRYLFGWMVWLLVFIIPILSMGLLAQEWATGTIETMMTAPLSETAIVMGKFLGLGAFFLVLLAPTLLYVLILAIFSIPRLDFGPIFSGYLGIILVGGLFISVGLFCSSLTRSQVVAAVSTIAILFLVTIGPWFASDKVLPGFWQKVIDQTVYHRYVDFSRGVIDMGHVVFFVLVTGVFIFLTIKVMESRRWR